MKHMKWAFLIAIVFNSLYLNGCQTTPFQKDEKSFSLAEKNNLPMATVTILDDSYISFTEEEQEKEYDRLLQKYSLENHVDWMFSKAVLIAESGYDPFIISNVGAVGLMKLMPREGSYTTSNYLNYTRAQKQHGRKYHHKTALQWANAYSQDLATLLMQYHDNHEELYSRDLRFNPDWNIKCGVKQLAEEFHHFQQERYSNDQSMRFAAAAYNAGRAAVEDNGAHIPVNGETEVYTSRVMNIYYALQRGRGSLLLQDSNVLE